MKDKQNEMILEDIKSKYFNTAEKHIFFCVGKKCDPDGLSEKIYKKLKAKLAELEPDKSKARIHRSKTSCLGVCKHGPLAVVYPDGLLYYNLKEEDIDKVIDHLYTGTQPEIPFFCMPEV